MVEPKLSTEEEPAAGYNVSITGRNVQVTEGMKQHAIDKLTKLERFTDRIIDIHITMDIQHLEHKVDLVMKFEHTKIKVQAVSDDMYASIDRAIRKIQSRLTKYRDRLRNHHAKPLSVVDMNVNVVQRPFSDLDEINEQIDDENQHNVEDSLRPHQVVKKETRPLKTLSTEEAIMKMELSQDMFLVYRSEEDQGIKVIYRRQDGDYGIIEPQN